MKVLRNNSLLGVPFSTRLGEFNFHPISPSPIPYSVNLIKLIPHLLVSVYCSDLRYDKVQLGNLTVSGLVLECGMSHRRY